jgi:hypothetical protein
MKYDKVVIFHKFSTELFSLLKAPIPCNKEYSEDFFPKIYQIHIGMVIESYNIHDRLEQRIFLREPGEMKIPTTTQQLA